MLPGALCDLDSKMISCVPWLVCFVMVWSRICFVVLFWFCLGVAPDLGVGGWGGFV